MILCCTLERAFERDILEARHKTPRILVSNEPSENLNTAAAFFFRWTKTTFRLREGTPTVRQLSRQSLDLQKKRKEKKRENFRKLRSLLTGGGCTRSFSPDRRAKASQRNRTLPKCNTHGASSKTATPEKRHTFTITIIITSKERKEKRNKRRRRYFYPHSQRY